MRIVGHGIDIVSVDRIEQMLASHGARFLDRCFTDREQAYAGDKRRRLEHLAGRFAAKEAVFKALGTGLTKGMQWLDVEVVNADSGQPQLRIEGRSLQVAQHQGIDQWWLSISHIETHATASAIAVCSQAVASESPVQGPSMSAAGVKGQLCQGMED